MRFSTMFIPTRKEDPASAEVVSHKLLVRGGYIRMLARGIYSYLPLGWCSIRKIEAVIRQEMDRSGAQEVMLPAVQPAELWEESGRWDAYGPELLRFEDRKGGGFCFGPTHEEVITDLVRGEIKSYKQLPLNLYQIQTKFRDEMRPRFGLMRGREFIMKDAYSFDVDMEAAKDSYDEMFEAYDRICQRLGFDYRAVEADTGNIGGSHSHEFQVLAETGEDEIVTCDNCGYAANVEKARVLVDDDGRPDVDFAALESVDTPGARTIDEVCQSLDRSPEQLVKTLIYNVDDSMVAVLVRGDHGANQVKVGDAIREHTDLEVGDLRLASDAEIEELTGAPVGFSGPVDLDVPVIADRAVESMVDFAVGANEADTHYVGVNWGRDFEVDGWAAVREARQGDPCPECGSSLETRRGIEIGHVFLLGDKYSEAMDAMYVSEDGTHEPMQMGCYGIGVSRILAAVVEQNHDDDGIIWPMPIAPFQVLMTVLHPDDEEVMGAAEDVYEQLQEAGVEVAMDDRDIGIGSKFADADLVGIPLRLTFGARGISDGNVEMKWRDEDDDELIAVDEVADRVESEVQKAMEGRR